MRALAEMAPGVLAAGTKVAQDAPARVHGLSRLLAEFHGEHRLLYALGTVGVLWATGALLGVAIEFALSALGWETEELETSE